MRDQYDVIVIGSGFGGAVTAARLAQAGRSVCMLERGRRWDKSQFPRSIGQAKNAMWRDNESFGFIEYKVFRRMDVIQGAGVGGGSLHYFNVHLRAPRDILERPGWPARMKRDTLEPYYDLAQDMLDSRPLEPRLPRFPLPRRTDAFAAAAVAAGRTPERVPIAVHIGPAGKNRHSGVFQEPCDYAGDCLFGCRTHSKNTLDITYIPMAETRHGLEVFPLHAVTGIEPAPSGRYRVQFARLDADRPGISEPGSVVGERVVIAAGSLGSTQLLLKCRDVHKSLPNLPAALGTRFSGNGDMLFAGTLGANRVVEPGEGPSITIGADFSRKGSRHRIYIEDLGFPNPFLWLLEGTLPSASRARGLLHAAGSYVGAALGVHRRTSRVGFEADNLFAGNRTEHLLPYLGMGSDAGDGVLKLDADGEIDLDWDPAASMEMFLEMEEGFKEPSAGLGGTYLRSLLWNWPFRRLLTAHPLGGCVMSDSPETGVVNDRGEIWGHPGLYVVDGAIVPSALTVNPSMTITALAERAAY
jgi:cholesterol oxidase